MNSAQLEQAIKHRQAKEYEEAQVILDELLTADPHHPMVNYQMAWLCDTQGKESTAVPYYERAIANGLEGEDLCGALLEPGRAYRTPGRYDESVATLRKGMATFPDAREFAVFLAMVLYNTGDHAGAMGLLLTQLTETSHDAGIQCVKRAIDFYHDKLDETWLDDDS